MDSPRPLLSVVVPCFNEEAALEELRRRLLRACRAAVGDDFEIVLVDDGSTDRTRPILARFRDEDAHFVVVVLSRNHGHQMALTAGLSFARGNRVLVLDADLQDPPELLPQLMAKMNEGFDVVYGRRRVRRGELAFKKITAGAFYRLLDRIIDVEIPADTGDFRLMSRRVVDILQQMPEQHRFIRGMVSWIGYPQTALYYDRDPRFGGETKYPLTRMLGLALDAITGFSIVPLKFATWIGFTFAAVAAILSVYVLASWMSGHAVAGWTSTILVVLFIGGAQLFVIGILGEYIGRLYLQSKGRPLFIIEEVLRSEQSVKPPQSRRKRLEATADDLLHS